MAERLQGCGILIIRPAGQGERLAELVRAEGGEPVLFPTIDILPPPRPARLYTLIARLHTFDWAVFVSPTAAREGVHAVLGRRRWPERLRLAAVGRGTAAALVELGFPTVLSPEVPGDSEALVALPEMQEVAGQNFVVFRGEGGREQLARTLAARGARVEYAECYRRARPAADCTELLARWREGGVHAICAASAEALSNLRELLGAQGAELALATPVFVPHPRIAEAARGLGFARTILVTGGDETTAQGLASFFARV